jgi:translocation and assembly module TamA
LQAETKVANQRQSLGLDFTIPHYRRNRQTLTLFAELSNEERDAFESEDLSVGAELGRQLSRHLRLVTGVELSLSKVTEDEVEGALVVAREEDFALLSLPQTLEYDRRDDALDPKRGLVGALSWRPFWDTRASGERFYKSTLALSAYFSKNSLPWQPTLALRSAMGVINGATREDVPANQRFYVGGGGSVRGYPFQSLGPLTNNDPDGGLSFNEYSAELRLRLSETWGAVVFVDGGFAYSENSPQLGEDLRWGTGLGLRYYTSFAPIRFDVALPLNKREQVDDSFQIYISIGQAF